MAEMLVNINEILTSRDLEDWEFEEFRDSNIDEIGIVVYPVCKNTGEELPIEIPFNYKSFKKKGGVFEGILIDGNSKYQLNINGQMKVKLRPGVVNLLNEYKDGVAMKVGFISRQGNDSGRIIVGLDKQNSKSPLSWLEVQDYTIT